MNPVDEFIGAIREAGIAITEPERIGADGNITRFHVDGDRHGSRHGWAVLFQDAHGAGGAFGHWRSGATGTWRLARGKLTRAEQERLHQAIERTKRLRQADRRRRELDAQTRADKLWAQAAGPDPQHAYLVRKGVAAHGIRQLHDALVIPARDAEGRLWTLQFIYPDGDKRFLSGGRKRGCYFSIGKIEPDHGELCIAEGYATAASIHEATGKAVAVAFDCGNLEPVARALRAKFRGAAITMCADNDINTAGNPGLTHAKAAARAVRGLVAVPPHGFNDFNDLARAGGIR